MISGRPMIDHVTLYVFIYRPNFQSVLVCAVSLFDLNKFIKDNIFDEEKSLATKQTDKKFVQGNIR